MMTYRTITLAVVGLFLSLSFLASSVVAAEKDGLTMKNGKVTKLHEGRDVGLIDRTTIMANGTKVMMNGKIVTKEGTVTQLEEGKTIMLDGKMMEHGKYTKMEELGR